MVLLLGYVYVSFQCNLCRACHSIHGIQMEDFNNFVINAHFINMRTLCHIINFNFLFLLEASSTSNVTHRAVDMCFDVCNRDNQQTCDFPVA